MKEVKKSICLLIFMFFISTTAFSNTWIRLDSVQLAKIKTKITNGTASQKTQIAYTELIKNANTLLITKNPSVKLYFLLLEISTII